MKAFGVALQLPVHLYERGALLAGKLWMVICAQGSHVLGGGGGGWATRQSYTPAG